MMVASVVATAPCLSIPFRSPMKALPHRCSSVCFFWPSKYASISFGSNVIAFFVRTIAPASIVLPIPTVKNVGHCFGCPFGVVYSPNFRPRSTNTGLASHSLIASFAASRFFPESRSSGLPATIQYLCTLSLSGHRTTSEQIATCHTNSSIWFLYWLPNSVKSSKAV